MSYYLASLLAGRGALTGQYPTASFEQLKEADSIIGLSFGTKEENTDTPHGRVNHLLAKRALSLGEELGAPLYLQQEIADAIEGGGSGLDTQTIAGEPSTLTGRGTTTASLLSGAMQRAADTGREINSPVIVAQAHHAGRVALQMAALSNDRVNPLLPPGLPAEFAPASKQLWTRSLLPWIGRELPYLAIWSLKD